MKCLVITIGRVHISRDVVFDENIFPFQSLHPNAGAQLRANILLLLDSLASTSSNNEGIHVNDHMHIVLLTVSFQLHDDSTSHTLTNSAELIW